jgi:hypothetical protein
MEPLLNVVFARFDAAWKKSKHTRVEEKMFALKQGLNSRGAGDIISRSMVID